MAPGRLAQIENPEVRLALAGFRGRIEDAVGNELLAREILTGQVYPEVSPNADFSALYLIDLAFFSGPRQLNQAAPTYGGVVTFPGSPRVKKPILYRTSWLAAELGEMRGLIAGVDSLKSLIDHGVN